jgi:hypothetical protein
VTELARYSEGRDNVASGTSSGEEEGAGAIGGYPASRGHLRFFSSRFRHNHLSLASRQAA